MAHLPVVSNDPPAGAGAPPNRIPNHVPARAQRLTLPAGHTGFRLVAAQQNDPLDSEGVFDDVLDELLPGDEPELPAEHSPAFPESPSEGDAELPDSPLPHLPDTNYLQGNDRKPIVDPELPDDGSPVFPEDPQFDTPMRGDARTEDTEGALDDDDLDDVFGDEPSVDVIPPPDEFEPTPAELEPEPTTFPESDFLEPTPAQPSERAPDAGSDSDADLDSPPVRPNEDLLPERVPDLPSLPRDGNPLRPQPSMPDLSLERAAPLELPEGDVAQYNGRDCPEEMADLQDAWNRLRRTPIQSITLDITPAVEPNESLDYGSPTPQDVVKRSPSRIWIDRRGKRIGEGKLEDYRQGKVIIRGADGETKSISWYDLSNADLCFVSAWWGIPTEFIPEGRPYDVRDWTMTTFTWTASGLCHKPLYFEEVQLERYGHTAGPMKQAVLSGVHFFGNIFFLPYHMGLAPPNECKYALGYYRPGDCAPWMVPATPLSSRAIRWQVGAVVSGLTLLP